MIAPSNEGFDKRIFRKISFDSVAAAEAPRHRAHRPAGPARRARIPMRLSLVGLLRREGPLTATQAGERTRREPGERSFHLRQLARYGLVEEAGGGRGRERPWQATALFTNWPSAADDPDVAAAADQLSRDRARALLRAGLTLDRRGAAASRASGRRPRRSATRCSTRRPRSWPGSAATCRRWPSSTSPPAPDLRCGPRGRGASTSCSSRSRPSRRRRRSPTAGAPGRAAGCSQLCCARAASSGASAPARRSRYSATRSRSSRCRSSPCSALDASAPRWAT